MVTAIKTRTARFAEVVKACGTPETVSLWTDPAHDKTFMSAVKQSRVMTIKEEKSGSRKDFGMVGFVPESHASYLVFPKPLTAFNDKRIVGIKYDLISSPAPLGTVVKPVLKRSATRAGASRASITPEPATTASSARGRAEPVRPPKLYEVVVRFTATAEATEQLEAANRKEAQKTALARAAVPDFTKSKVVRKVVRVRAL